MRRGGDEDAVIRGPLGDAGKAVAVASGYVSIWLPGVRIELNKVTKSNFGKQVTRQAVKITNRLNGQAIVVGEATAGYSGSPCKGFLP